jgi:hypothetical protein
MSVLGQMFNDYNTPDKDKDGCYFIDRSGKYFDHILEFLRDDDGCLRRVSSFVTNSVPPTFKWITAGN